MPDQEPDRGGERTVPAAETTLPAAVASWIAPVVRAVLALVTTVLITFSPDHSAAFGLAVFGGWAIGNGLIVGALQLRTEPDRVNRMLCGLAAVVSVAAGILAFTLPPSLGLLLVLVSAWAAITGFVELFAGLRTRGRSPVARDRLAAGAFTAILAVVLVLLPGDSVVSVGLFGAYLAILGVFLMIGGLSLKWAGSSGAAPAPAPPDETDAR
jgi:uncharacterized membrane protein HdeD (DUF308 family)